MYWLDIVSCYFRVDNVDQASQAKAEIEQKQRNEAEARKERNDVWIPQVIKISYSLLNCYVYINL